ncbi:hypothetical protein [Euzebya tangerina]|uniref:hypothetical protein n=1 Tax=Euzebya tangerina TaxID=591198 RepID=UPI000E30D741|nr:hypothetical protein [Euzebya tangerina]
MVFRPDNATEGYVALVLAGIIVAWQSSRLAGQGLRVTPETIASPSAALRVSEVTDLRWVSRHHAGRPAHRLVANTSHEEVLLCRSTATTPQAERFVAEARALGLVVREPTTARR